jgi:uncharacterized protein (DUF1330 family)
MYYAVMIAAIIGIAVGAGVTGLKAQPAPKAYIITEVDVTGNMDVFLRDYAAHVQATVEPFGGHYLVRGGRNVGIEGEPPKGRIVISVFDSFEKGAHGGIRPRIGRYCRCASARRNRACISSRGCRTNDDTPGIAAIFRVIGIVFVVRSWNRRDPTWPVIPGPPQAEPGIQEPRGHGRLDSGFAQARARPGMTSWNSAT